MKKLILTIAIILLPNFVFGAGLYLGATTKGGVGSGVATPAMNTTYGSTIIIGVTYGSAPFTIPIDSFGNVWIPIKGAFGTNPVTKMFYNNNGPRGTGQTFSWNDGGGSTVTFNVLEVLGGYNDIIDASIVASDASTPYTSGNITTTNSDELIVTFDGNDSASATTAYTVNAGFQITNTNPDGVVFWSNAMAYGLLANVGSIGGSWTSTAGTTHSVWTLGVKAGDPSAVTFMNMCMF